jgi:hypothetical protein
MRNTLAQAIGPLLAGGMEICWMAGVLQLLQTRTSTAALAAVWLPALGLPTALILGRFTLALSRPRRAGIGLAAGLAWTLILIEFTAFPAQSLSGPARLADFIAALFQAQGGPNTVQIAALAASAGWIAGLRLAGAPIGFEQILAEFQFGLVVLLGVLFCAAQLGRDLPAMPGLAVAFFVLFLAGMAAVRSAEARRWQPETTRSPWAAVLLCNAALVLSIGFLLAAVVTPGVLALVLGFLEAAWDAMTEWVVRFVAFLARLLPQPEIKAYGVGAGGGPGPQNPSAVPDLLSIPDYVRRIAAWLVSAFWIALFAVSLWRMASQIAGWLRRQMDGGDGAQIEPLPGFFRQDLLRLLRYLRRRLSGWIAWLRYAAGRRTPAEAPSAEASAVRRLYRAVLAWSAAGGCPRREHQTPHEFLARLCERLPQARPELTLITEQYAAVRYGNRRPGAEAVRALERLWQDVRKMRKRPAAPARPGASSERKDC